MELIRRTPRSFNTNDPVACTGRSSVEATETARKEQA